MELIPRAMVVGVLLAPPPPGQQQVSTERLTRIWGELAPAHGLTQLQMSPDGTAANFIGRRAEDGVTIQPPLAQVRTAIDGPARLAAETAQSSMATIVRNLGSPQIFNLAIKHIYAAPIPGNDARNFVLRRIMRTPPEDLEGLAADPNTVWGGIKYVIPLPDRQYTLVFEPLLTDTMRSLYIDLDMLFPGPADASSIAGRAAEAQDYLSGAVVKYLDERADDYS